MHVRLSLIVLVIPNCFHMIEFDVVVVGLLV